LNLCVRNLRYFCKDFDYEPLRGDGVKTPTGKSVRVVESVGWKRSLLREEFQDYVRAA